MSLVEQYNDRRLYAFIQTGWMYGSKGVMGEVSVDNLARFLASEFSMDELKAADWGGNNFKKKRELQLKAISYKVKSTIAEASAKQT